MTVALYLPPDSITGGAIDFNLAADFLELSAFFAETKSAPVLEIKNTIDIGASEDHVDMNDENLMGSEEVVSGTVNLIESRGRALEKVYPYKLDDTGNILEYAWDSNYSFGQTAYILCLILSNLTAMTPVLTGSSVYPKDAEINKLRTYFQYFATAAMAAEIGGRSWSFGFPRPDRSGFLDKLKEIWTEIRDGRVEAQPGAPLQPKDDKIDVFAARPHLDRLPGFLLAAAQVATGQGWRDKSLKGHLDAFRKRWFGSQPATDFIPYMIVPFALSDDELRNDVRGMGNMLHRLRVPRRVQEASKFESATTRIDVYCRLDEAVQWIADYRLKAVPA